MSDYSIEQKCILGTFAAIPVLLAAGVLISSGDFPLSVLVWLGAQFVCGFPILVIGSHFEAENIIRRKRGGH